MSKKIVAMALSLILLINIYIPVMAVTQEELNDIKTKKEEAENEKAQIEEELTATLKEITKLDVSISELNEEIDSLKNKISDLEDSIEQKEQELKKKQKEHEENTELMEERLVVMYESGENTFLDLLFKSENLVEFISSYYTLSQITQCDKELLESIEKEQKEIEEVKKSLEDEKVEVDSAKIEKETKNNLLIAQNNERKAKANGLSEEEKELDAKIKQYQQDYDNKQQELKRQAEEAARRSSSSSSSQSGDGLNFDGSFIWPCNNKVITSGVKRRWGRWHKGIDIGARYEPVYASASGYAYTLYDRGGYGNYIIIVHGGGWCTLYGHLDSYNITSGQYVSQGQVIATSGNTGGSQGPHLHFEIRKASSLSTYFSAGFLNGLDYLPGGWTAQAGAFTES